MQKLPQELLVEDNSTTILLKSLLLNRLQVAAQLLIARHGAAALQPLNRTCGEATAAAGPLLVLLDVTGPVRKGADFLEAYPQHPLAQKCPLVVVLTNSEHCRDAQWAGPGAFAAAWLARCRPNASAGCPHSPCWKALVE